jgi:hypothetical protein
VIWRILKNRIDRPPVLADGCDLGARQISGRSRRHGISNAELHTKSPLLATPARSGAPNFLFSCHLLESLNEHAVAVGIEPVALSNRVAIGIEDVFFSA